MSNSTIENLLRGLAMFSLTAIVVLVVACIVFGEQRDRRTKLANASLCQDFCAVKEREGVAWLTQTPGWNPRPLCVCRDGTQVGL